MAHSKHYNILLVHNKYLLAGGEDTVVCNEKQLLESHGHKVYLYERRNSELDDYSIIQKIRLPFRTIYSLSAAKAIQKLIVDNKIDIVHVHNTLPLISFSVYRTAKRCGCGLVQTIHNFRFLCPNGIMYRGGHVCEECLNGLSHSIKHACYRGSRLQTTLVVLSLWFHRFFKTFELPDAYITLTGFNKGILESIIPPNKIVIKPNFNPSASSAANSVNIITKKTSPKRRESYVYVSRLDESKGIFKLLEAFQQMPSIKLDIIGTGPVEQKVQDYIKDKEMKNVHFLGYLEHDKTLEYIYHAKALLFPTQWYEGFPMTIAESFSLGTPVIGSNIGNVAWIVESGKTGLLFQPDSVNDLIQKVSDFNRDNFDFEKMENACLSAFNNKYSAELNYRMLYNIYKKIRG